MSYYEGKAVTLMNEIFPPAAQSGGGEENFDINQAVNEAMAGLTMDDLLTRVKTTASAPDASEARPVRGGRPSGVADEAVDNRVRRGVVAAIRGGSVFVDLGGKSQGVCPLEHFAPADLNLPEQAVRIGEEHEFVFAGYNAAEGLVLLSRKGSVNHGGWDQLHDGDIVEGVATAANKGGLEVKINNLRAFMPAGQVDVKFTADLNLLVGERFKCQIIEIDRMEKRLIVSRRVLMEAELAVKREKLWTELATGQIVTGLVTRVVPFGAFVDLGGVEGLIHVSAMSHGRVSDPGKIVRAGDSVQVMILSLDREKQRIALDLRYRMADPWLEVSTTYPIGAMVEGTVTRLIDFGVFVELAPGVEGMVHVSELSSRRVAHPRQVVSPGDRVRLKVLSIDLDKKRISLSISQAQSAEMAAAEAPKVSDASAQRNMPAMPAAAPEKPKANAGVQRVLKGGL